MREEANERERERERERIKLNFVIAFTPAIEAERERERERENTTDVSHEADLPSVRIRSFHSDELTKRTYWTDSEIIFKQKIRCHLSERARSEATK